MSTFIGQLVGFAVIVWLVWRYVVPPVRRLMTARQDTVRQQLADSAAAGERLKEASRRGNGSSKRPRPTPNASPNNCKPRPGSTRNASQDRVAARSSCCAHS